jgi:hypothetical protein
MADGAANDVALLKGQPTVERKWREFAVRVALLQEFPHSRSLVHGQRHGWHDGKRQHTFDFDERWQMG